MVTKMDTKKLLVSLSLAILAIFMVATVSATSSGLVQNNSLSIEVDGVNIENNPAVIAGEDIAVVVEFTAAHNASDVTVELELGDNKVTSESFDVEAGFTYTTKLKLEVPFDLKDELSDDVELEVRIESDDYESNYENNDFMLRVQRPSYNPEIKLIGTPSSVEAGETFKIDLVLKNMGYNELEDTYVTVALSGLEGVYRTIYSGDLVPIEVCNDDCEEDDTVTAELYLTVPYSADAGVYALEVFVSNDDVDYSATKDLVVKNDFSSNVITTTFAKTAYVGESADYTFLLVNPTNELRVYTLAVGSSDEVSVSTQTIVAVPAGSTETVTLTAKASEAGQYNVVMNVVSGSDVEEVTFKLTAEQKTATNPIVVLTVILAIIFLVLLVVLIVLLGKKPAKTEEFGESYY